LSCLRRSRARVEYTGNVVWNLWFSEFP